MLGAWQANCYVLGDRDVGRAVVVDPGQDGEAHVRDALDRNGVACEAILLTHGHVDHIWSVPDLARLLDAPAFLHPDDSWLWRNPAAAFGEQLPVTVLDQQFGLRWDPYGVELEELVHGARLMLGGLTFGIRHAPGHTPGSCVFLLDTAEGPTPLGPDLLLSGDLIFAGSVGRTDFPRGSHEALLASIRRHVLELDDATVIASGHGPHTTVGAERRANPFLS